MKPQIEELFKQIRKQKHTYNLMSNPPQIRYNYTIEEADIEKFAALIVKECVQVCNNIDAEYEGEDVLATWCATAIKEHFEVGE